MIQSMTGYGKGAALSETKKITLEIKSLNSKQLDLQIRMPGQFREQEVPMRSRISEIVERGKVEVAVNVESIGQEATASINADVMAGYVARISEISDQLQIAKPEDWYSVLLRLPDVVQTRIPEANESDDKALYEALEEALKALVDYRSAEGEKLEVFMRSKVANIGALLSEVEPFEKERVEKIRKRLEEQLVRLTTIEYEPGRLEQEMIFYIEKLDVNEEKQRLRSHINYFLETMQSTREAGKGKKLGFIAQEMGREINTLGSKSNNAEMQKIVVRMKDELEQIKEQVLNIL